MKSSKILTAVLVSALAFSISAPAQERGAWRAASKTASAITGDVALSADKLMISFTPFAVAQIRALEPAELKAAFDLEDGAAGSGNLYKVDIPASKKFLHKNSLCAAEDALWMISYVNGKTLQLAFFSGQKLPVFTFEAITNSTNLCGTFTYVR